MIQACLLAIATLCFFVQSSWLQASEIHLDLTNVLYSTKGTEGFKLFHVGAQGLSGRYWVEFRWDPKTLAFQPVDASIEQGYIVIDAEELKSMMAQGGNYALLDVRSQEEYAKGHIYGALNYPTDKSIRDFPDEVKLKIQQDFPDKNRQIIVYCGGLGCGRSGWAADSLVSLGYTNVFRFQAGYTGWCEAGYSFVITGDELKELINSGDTNYLLVDVREEYEYNEGHIPTAINVPLSRIRSATSMADLEGELPQEGTSCSDWTRPLIVYCAGLGTRYAEAAQKLAQLGYKRLVTFPGGMEEWNSMGLQYKYKTISELTSLLGANASVHVVDIRVEEEYSAAHIKGSIATYAYPVKSETDKAKLDAIIDTLSADNSPIVIVCPRGAGGAERTYEYLYEKGISEDRLYILKDGWAGWQAVLNLTKYSN